MQSLWFRTLVLLALGAALGMASNVFGPKKDRISWIREIGVTPAATEKGDVSASAVRLFAEKFPDKATILDARRKEEFVKGHIPGALSLDIRQFDQLFPAMQSQLLPELPVVVYCGGGDCEDSHALAERLRGFGYEPLIFAGGWEAWTAAKFPVQTGESL